MINPSKHLRKIENCPWCGISVDNSKELYKTEYDCTTVECSCGFVYSNKILNEEGLSVYWQNYESNVHLANVILNEQRLKMYKLEAEYVLQYLNKDSLVLDVGCSGGEFLDCFEKSIGKKNCEGVEFGEEAYNIASKKYHVYFGEFPKIKLEKKYDLVIFRGTIQYFINPKTYIKKAFEILKDGGILYITSSPNADSFCFKLFKEKFTLPVNYTDYYGYKEPLLTDYIREIGGELIAQKYFYKETPYADIEHDIERVAEAIRDVNTKGVVSKASPAFFDNMLTLVYKKLD